MNEIAGILALIAALSFALAATLWQRASMDAGVEPGDAKGMIGLLTSWVWLLGLGAQILGVLLQGAALDRGRVAIIQPLLVTSIIWALPLGYFLTNQTVTRRHIAGAAIIVVGLATFGGVGDPAGGVDDAPLSDWLAVLVVAAAVCVGLMTIGARGGANSKAALFGATAGVLYGVSATLMKPVVEAWHDEGIAVLADWEFWVMAVSGLTGFYLQQMSLATGRLVTSVATVSVVNPVVSVSLGAIVLQERLDSDPKWHWGVAVGALALTLFGAVVIAAVQRSARPRATRSSLPWRDTRGASDSALPRRTRVERCRPSGPDCNRRQWRSEPPGARSDYEAASTPPPTRPRGTPQEFELRRVVAPRVGRRCADRSSRLLLSEGRRRGADVSVHDAARRSRLRLAAIVVADPDAGDQWSARGADDHLPAGRVGAQARRGLQDRRSWSCRSNCPASRSPRSPR